MRKSANQKKDRETGVYCIALGCTNGFKKCKAEGRRVHFHRLPLSKPLLLQRWCKVMRRADPPLNCNSRMCSVHFVDADYVRILEPNAEGRMEFVKTNKLLPGAVPSLFDFSRYNLGSTDIASTGQTVNKKRTKKALQRSPVKSGKAVRRPIKRLLKADDQSPEADESEVQPASAVQIKTPATVSIGTHADPVVCSKPVTHSSMCSGTDQIGDCSAVFHDHPYSRGTQCTSETDDATACPQAAERLASEASSMNSEEPVHMSVCTSETDGASACPQADEKVASEASSMNSEEPVHMSVCTSETDGASACPQADEKVASEASSMNSEEPVHMSVSDDVSSSEYAPTTGHDFCATLSSDEWSGAEGEDPVRVNKKIIVEELKLRELFHVCHVSGCRKSLIGQPSFQYEGFGVVVRTSCVDGHDFVWTSQSMLNGIMSCNVLLPSAIFLTGNAYGPFVDVCRCVGLQALSPRHCFNMQRSCVIPEIERAWTLHNEAVLATIKDKSLTLAGDAQCDSPGHGATLGTYSLLDVDSNLIISQESVQVTEVKNSHWLEPEGLQRCLSKLTDHEVRIRTLATDQHPTVRKMLRENHREIKHEYDLWHIVKGLKKKLSRTKSKDLLPWVKAIANHLCYCVDSCQGDVVTLKEKWTSVLHHVTNKHKWVSGGKVLKCDHSPYTEMTKSRLWLKEDSKAFSILQSAVMDKGLLKSMEKVTERIHAGELESVHSLYQKYAPKRKKFSLEGYRARLHLAALDHNDNVGRKQARNLSGKVRYQMQYSKAAKDYIFKPVKATKSYNFRSALMTGITERCLRESSMRKLVSHQCVDDEKHKKTIGQHAGAVKPSKEETLRRHKSFWRKKLR